MERQRRLTFLTLVLFLSSLVPTWPAFSGSTAAQNPVAVQAAGLTLPVPGTKVRPRDLTPARPPADFVPAPVREAVKGVAHVPPPVQPAPNKLKDLKPRALSFIPNQGQFDPAVAFQVEAAGGTVFVTPDEIGLKRSAPRFVAANRRASVCSWFLLAL